MYKKIIITTFIIVSFLIIPFLPKYENKKELDKSLEINYDIKKINNNYIQYVANNYTCDEVLEMLIVEGNIYATEKYAVETDVPVTDEDYKIAYISQNNMNSYFVSQEEPKNKKEGMLWFKLGKNFVLRNEKVVVKIDGVYQYKNNKFDIIQAYQFYQGKRYPISPITKEIVYTGSIVEYTFTLSGNYILEAWGGSGGTSYMAGPQYSAGGKGGYAKGKKRYNAGEKIYIAVGGAGGNGTIPNGGAGGYNGGGSGGRSANTYYGAGGGGGATHITTTNRGLLNYYAQLNCRQEIILVAAGGGGASRITKNCGAGGGESGANGCDYYGNNNIAGGTQFAGHGFGVGGNGAGKTQLHDNGAEGNGGGGGGFYGGHASTKTGNRSWASGAGGSSYVSSSLEERLTETGKNEGNGLVKITYLGE